MAETSPYRAAELRPRVGQVDLSLSLGPEGSLSALVEAIVARRLRPGSRVTVRPSEGRSLSTRGVSKLARNLAYRGIELVWSLALGREGAEHPRGAEFVPGVSEVWLVAPESHDAHAVKGYIKRAESFLSAGYRVGIELEAGEPLSSCVQAWIQHLRERPELFLRVLPALESEIGRSAEIAQVLATALQPTQTFALAFPLCLLPSTLPGEVRDFVGWSTWQTPASVRRLKPAGCAGCDRHTQCNGVAAATIHHHGDQALVPFHDVRLKPAGNSLLGVPIATRVADVQVAETERLDISPRYPDTSLMTLIVPGCDLNCIFCEGEEGGVSLEASSLLGVRAALVATAGQSSGVFFTGGEPTQLPWLIEAIESAKELGYTRIQMQSHAGPAGDIAFAQKLVDAGLTAVDVPLYGATADVHESITNTPGSFEATVAGVRTLSSLGAEVVLHATLFRSNLDTLPEILGFMASLKPAGVYLQVTGEVGAPGTYERVAPPPSEVAAAVTSAVQEVSPTFPLRVAGVPRCLLPSQAEYISRWEDTPEYAASAVVLPFTEWLSTFSAGKTRDYGISCEDCSIRDECDGLSHEALLLFGEGELRPQ